jgi:hypothetical protein
LLLLKSPREEGEELKFTNRISNMGSPPTRIAELMKVDRNTINNDLKIQYGKALNDFDLDDMSLDDILQKQLLRLETQRYRLGLYLCDTKEINNK